MLSGALHILLKADPGAWCSRHAVDDRKAVANTGLVAAVHSGVVDAASSFSLGHIQALDAGLPSGGGTEGDDALVRCRDETAVHTSFA